MQFPNIDDDDGDFGLSNTSRSRLSSLFQPERTSGDVNQALTFTAPKQPKKNETLQGSQETLKLIHSAAVHAYKLIDGNYNNQGKLGCAILGLHETSDYKLLLYKGKQAQVSICNILPSFKFHVQSNNYASFYDDKNENWSINFDSDSALPNFAKQIALSKFNAQDKSQPSLIIQDLAHGDGSALDMGDSAEVKYIGWLLTNYSFGQVFDTNMQSESVFRLRLGKKIIKGWSDGLVAAQRNTKRLLIVPPALAYGAEGMGSTVPPNSTLIFEIHVIKVKKTRDSSHSPSPLKVSENIPDKKPEVAPRHSSITSEDNIRLRGASISEQLSQSPKKDKAQLISRMAKMGTATLPFQGAIPAQANSDSESEEETLREKSSPPVQQVGSRTSSPKPTSRPTSRKNSEQLTTIPPNQLQCVQESIPFHVNQASTSAPFFAQPVMSSQPYCTPTNSYPAFQPQMTPQYPTPQIQYPSHTMPGVLPHMPSIIDSHLPILISESRTQNTEVRLNLSKISEKVDIVIQKISELNMSQGRTTVVSQSSFLDSAMLVQSIEKIVQENSQLKEDTACKNLKIQSLNEKICDLLQRNQRFFEETNNKSDSFQAASAESQVKLVTLEKEKLQLHSELSETVNKLKALETEITNHQSEENELKVKLKEQQKQIEDLEFKLNNFKEKSDSESIDTSLINSLQSEIKDLSNEKSLLNSRLREWEEKYNLLNEDISDKNKKLQELQKQLLESKSVDEKSVTHSQEEIEMLKKEIESVQVEKKVIVMKCEDLQSKLAESAKSESLLKRKLSSLQADLQNSLIWKDKYEAFYQKALQWKEVSENEKQRLLTELKQSNTSSPDFSGEIKKVMNVLYKLLQGKFESQSSYKGKEVLETTLQAIRGLTLNMLEKKDQRTDSLTKESDSESATMSSELNCTETVHSETVPEKVDNNSEVPIENSVQENGISEDVSICSDAPSACDSQSQSAEERDNSLKLQQTDTELIEDNSAKGDFNEDRLHSNTDLQTTSSELNEIIKPNVPVEVSAVKTLPVQETRDSPDHHKQQLSSDASLSETPKV